MSAIRPAFAPLLLLWIAGCGAAWTLQDQDGDGWTLAEGDCDDADAGTHPGALERCDGRDNDCSGAVDDLDPERVVNGAVALFLDGDGDGWGDAAAFMGRVCPGGSIPGTVDRFGDCDDRDPDINPDATEICDALDNDCDGTVDQAAADADHYWPDRDFDGYGDGFGTPEAACSQPPADALTAWVLDDSDCDDQDPQAHPGAPEICGDDLDNDCDDLTDEGDCVPGAP